MMPKIYLSKTYAVDMFDLLALPTKARNDIVLDSL